MMRVTIAGVFFYLQASEVESKMSNVKPETITTESVRIGRRNYPVKQVGALVTRQDPRDFSTGEIVRALTQLGFTCQPKAVAAPTPAPEPAPLADLDSSLTSDWGSSAPVIPPVLPAPAPSPAPRDLPSASSGFLDPSNQPQAQSQPPVV
ncbi:SCO5918 family protein [Streptomyces sp. H27-D2]|uniref:SCO5918 family protein n=1 Tax=Streptomyces sp. H27-D2 TaxID=3046304 RepID=UPI002DB91577|nr:SCO5918 family protein [Streptomyces sp. H27-D2]MEC4018156.1 SCO5918 family protein [Streptomyces sp. H27-D2]